MKLDKIGKTMRFRKCYWHALKCRGSLNAILTLTLQRSKNRLRIHTREYCRRKFIAEMPAKEEKHVVITGVSSGIGFALATLLAKSGYKVYGSIRKQQDADNLVKELGPNFTPLLFDVRDERKIKEAAEKVILIYTCRHQDCILQMRVFCHKK